MTTHHAASGEIVNLDKWANDLPTYQTKVIVKTNKMGLVRLILSVGEKIPNHKMSGSIAIQCVKREIQFTIMGATQVANDYI